jgi:hypothetical protein
MTRLIVALGLLCAAAGQAAAQASAGSISQTIFDPNNPTAPMTGVEGPGVKVGEGTVLHPIFGVQTGFISNVFYEENLPQSAGLIRLMAQIGTASLSQQRLTPADGGDAVAAGAGGQFEYRADLRLAYDFVLSGNERVAATGGLGIGALLRGTVNPTGRWAFGAEDHYRRIIRAANFETDANTNRHLNNLELRARFQPAGRTLSGQLSYLNTIDVFERNEQNFANRMLHRLALRPAWRWLPKTEVFANISQGLQYGLGGSSMKVTSFPFQAVGGVATLLTARTTLNLQAGYTNGFYSTGPSFSNVTAGAQLGYRYSPLGRVALTYALLYEDSINANFFRDHVVRLWLHQLFVPFEVMLQPAIHFRRYEGITVVAGPPTRDDMIVSIIGGINYNFRDWFATTLNYNFALVSTDYRYMVDGITDDPGFVRHELILGMRMAM